MISVEVQIKDPAAGVSRTLKFSQSPVRIGRNQLNDISLQDPFISEWHGVIRFDDRGLAYFDMGSTNGTLLDGRRLAKNVGAELSDKSRLQMGRLEMTVIRQRAETGPHKTLGWGQDAALPPAPTPPGAMRGPALGPRRSPSLSGSSTRMGLSDSDLPDPTGERRPAPTPPPAMIGMPGMPQGVPSASSASASSSSMAASSAASSSAAALLGGAAAELAPGGAATQALARQKRLLEAFSEAFVGLRKGYEQFGAEVGVRTINGATPLHRARSSREVMDYLQHPGIDPDGAARDLIAIFADFAIHHIAMMEGVTEGVRAVLQSLDPRANDLEAAPRLFGSKVKTQWKDYLERFDQVITEDEELHAAIFGEEFARAYASVTMGADGSKPPGGGGAKR